MRRSQFTLKSLLWVLTWSAIAASILASSARLFWPQFPELTARQVTGLVAAGLSLAFVCWRIAVGLLKIRDLDL